MKTRDDCFLEKKVEKEKLELIFGQIRNYFDGMDKIREEILPLQRQIVRTCSEIIKKIHRNEEGNIQSLIAQTKIQLMDMQTKMGQAPGEFVIDYLQIVQQEYGEAAILYDILMKNTIPTPQDIGIGTLEYSYALADVMGELRRFLLNCVKREDTENAQLAFKWMEEIYNQLFTLDYPKGLLPGLRTKIDQARGILAKTEGDLSVALDMLRLNRNLERFFKEKDDNQKNM